MTKQWLSLSRNDENLGTYPSFCFLFAPCSRTSCYAYMLDVRTLLLYMVRITGLNNYQCHIKNRSIDNFISMSFAAAVFCILYCVLWVLCDIQGPPLPLRRSADYSQRHSDRFANFWDASASAFLFNKSSQPHKTLNESITVPEYNLPSFSIWTFDRGGFYSSCVPWQWRVKDICLLADKRGGMVAFVKTMFCSCIGGGAWHHLPTPYPPPTPNKCSRRSPKHLPPHPPPTPPPFPSVNM